MPTTCTTRCRIRTGLRSHNTGVTVECFLNVDARRFSTCSTILRSGARSEGDEIKRRNGGRNGGVRIGRFGPRVGRLNCTGFRSARRLSLLKRLMRLLRNMGLFVADPRLETTRVIPDQINAIGKTALLQLHALPQGARVGLEYALVMHIAPGLVYLQKRDGRIELTLETLGG